MNKEEIRIKINEMRKKQDVLTLLSASKNIVSNINSLDEFRGKVFIAGYLALPWEASIDEIIDGCLKTGKKVAVPAYDVDKDMYVFSLIENFTDIKYGRFFVREPSEVKYLDPQELELIFVPGIAFDRNLNRLGHGKGYYDRLLKGLKAIKVGVCFDFQIVENIPVSPYDIPMDIVVSDKRVLRKTAV